MVSKCLLLISSLAGGAILLGASLNPAQAQNYRGGQSPGGSSGGFYGGRLFYGDYSTGGGYPGYFAPFAYPNSPPNYGSFAASYGSISPSYGNFSGFLNSSGGALKHTYARMSFYSPPTYLNPIVAGEPPAYFYTPFMSRPAGIHVSLPTADAVVLLDGNKTKSTGTSRLYETPDLMLGGTYYYQLRATWMKDGKEVTQEKRIAVNAGEITEVVFPLPSEAKTKTDR